MQQTPACVLNLVSFFDTGCNSCRFCIPLVLSSTEKWIGLYNRIYDTVLRGTYNQRWRWWWRYKARCRIRNSIWCRWTACYSFYLKCYRYDSVNYFRPLEQIGCGTYPFCTLPIFRKSYIYRATTHLMKGNQMKFALITAGAIAVVISTVVVISLALFQRTYIFLDQNR